MKTLFAFLMKMFAGTPWWAWAFFAYAMFVGVRATKYRIIYAPYLLFIPAVFFWSRYRIFLSGNSMLIAVYLASVVLGQIIGFVVGLKAHIKIFKSSWSVGLSGSYKTLGFFISFFALKYIFGYLMVMQPALAPQFFIADVSLSSFLAGYLLGKGKAYILRIWKAA